MVAFFGLIVESNGELTGDRVLVDGGGVTEVKVVDDGLSLGLPEVLFYLSGEGVHRIRLCGRRGRVVLRAEVESFRYLERDARGLRAAGGRSSHAVGLKNVND